MKDYLTKCPLTIKGDLSVALELYLGFFDGIVFPFFLSGYYVLDAC